MDDDDDDDDNNNKDDDVLSRRCFSLFFLPVPQVFILIPLSIFIYLCSLSIRSFILNLFLSRTESDNKKKSQQILFFINIYLFCFILTNKCKK